MSFPFHLPKEAGQTRRFDPVGLGANVYHTYSVPEGAVALQIIATGGGGGGGNGFSAAAAAATGLRRRLLLPAAAAVAEGRAR